MDREKVIIAIELHRTGKCQDTNKQLCPYWEYEDCYEQVADDALSLLKELKPRVMKLEDVKAFGWDYCYLEEERLPGKEYRSVCGDYALTCITWPCIASMRILHGDDNYGKKWRCWTAKPTEDQRQAVKWDKET